MCNGNLVTANVGTQVSSNQCYPIWMRYESTLPLLVLEGGRYHWRIDCSTRCTSAPPQDSEGPSSVHWSPVSASTKASSWFQESPPYSLPPPQRSNGKTAGCMGSSQSEHPNIGCAVLWSYFCQRGRRPSLPCRTSNRRALLFSLPPTFHPYSHSWRGRPSLCCRQGAARLIARVVQLLSVQFLDPEPPAAGYGLSLVSTQTTAERDRTARIVAEAVLH